MKEYEKILELDNKLELNKKAITLVKLGCFEQKDVAGFDPKDYTDLTVEGKLYKGLYSLYQNADGDLIYANPEIEADENGEVHGEASSYDVLFIETMTEENFIKISTSKTAKSGLLGFKILYWLFLFVAVLSVVLTFASFITSIDTYGGFYLALQQSLLYIFFCNLNVIGFAIYAYMLKKDK